MAEMTDELYEALVYASQVLYEFLDTERADWGILQVLQEDVDSIIYKYRSKPVK